MGDGQPARLQVGEHGLDVADGVAAGGGIARVAHRGVAGQAGDEVALAEGVAHVAQVALGGEALAVEAGHAARLLAAMLQGVEAERDQGRGVRHVPDAEHAALQPRPVVVRIPLGKGGGLGDGGHRARSTTVSTSSRVRRV